MLNEDNGRIFLSINICNIVIYLVRLLWKAAFMKQ